MGGIKYTVLDLDQTLAAALALGLDDPKPRRAHMYQRILVPTDGSRLSAKAV